MHEAFELPEVKEPVICPGHGMMRSRQEVPRTPGETPPLLVPQVRVVFKSWSHILS